MKKTLTNITSMLRNTCCMLLLSMIAMLFTQNAMAQDFTQITNLSGSSTVNGNTVTVTSSGSAGELTPCGTTASPYYIYEMNGSYTFTFATPVSSVVIPVIFGQGIREKVRFIVNGTNFDITSANIVGPSFPNCGDFFVATDSAGLLINSIDVDGLPSAEINIAGSITSITVEGADSGVFVFGMFAAAPAGSGFGFTGADPVTGAQNLVVGGNSDAVGIGSLMAVNDGTTGNSITWSIGTNCSHGSLAGFPGTLSSNGGTVTPSGVTYTPTPGYTGFDQFVIQATNGTSTSSATVNVTVNAAPAVTYSVSNVSCNGGNNGSIVISATGGTGTLTGTGTYSSLSAGSYSYTVVDAIGGKNTVTPSVTQPSAISVSLTPTNVSCNSANGGNNNNGSISSSVTGGTGSYSYSWAPGGGTSANPTGKAPGTYTVTVTDGNGCTKAGSATISEPTAIAVTTTVTNVSCTSTNNGSISTSVSGGTGSYSYAWTPSGSGATKTGVTAGTYSVTVTDANSCTKTVAATVTQNTGASSTITGSNTVLGGLTYTYSGPSGMSSYSWAISGGNHVCDAHCHHHSSHSCGSGCDHNGQSCNSSCHHHSSHSCSNQHYGDHHCGSKCHHGSGHSCNANCDHYGTSCNSACHHHSYHHCGHTHCGSAAISGSTTGSSVNISTPCCAGVYTVTLTTTNSTGCSSTSAMAVTVTPSSQVTLYSNIYVTGSGNHPAITKSALASDIKVFNRGNSYGGKRDRNQSHYASIWNSTTGIVSSAVVSSPTTVTLGGGPAYQYVITVPANGSYLIVGKSVVSSSAYSGGSVTIYNGTKAGNHCDDDDDDDEDDINSCNNTIVKFHSVLKDAKGKCVEGNTQLQHGSLMVMVSPATLEFEDTTALMPIVYESVEGDWSVSVTADPPYGFYAVPSDALSTSLTDSVLSAVQFEVVDTGSEWTNTKLTHTIQHKGAERIAHSSPKMVNLRTNKPSAVNINPNPATDMINVVLPNFEGSATLSIYNVTGQKVAEKPIHIVGGESVSMDISSLVPGVYMVTAENQAGKGTGRLIKKEK